MFGNWIQIHRIQFVKNSLSPHRTQLLCYSRVLLQENGNVLSYFSFFELLTRS